MPQDDADAQTLNPKRRSVSGGGRRVLDCILRTGGISQADITRSLDLSQPTVARLLQGFQQDAMIKVSNRQVDRPGNPSVHVTLDPDFAFSLGISMLGDALSMLVMDFSGKVRGTRTAAMPSMSQDAVIDTLKRFKSELLSDLNISPHRVIGAGVGISGFFVGKGRLINTPIYLNDWALIDVEPILEDALNLPIFLDNDGTVAAIGECLFGVGKSCNDFAFLHLTNGFGGGIIANGKPVRGFNGNGGELGGVWTICGEGYPNLDLLKTCVAKYGGNFDTVEDLVRTIDRNWSGVEDWLDQAVKPFSTLTGLLSCILNPELVVIGGRLPLSIAEALVERIVIPEPTNRLGHPLPMPKVVASSLTGDAVAMGAAAMPLQAAFFI